MVACTSCNLRVASSGLACVAFVFFFWQGRLVHMSMNTASRGLSVHPKRLHLSGCMYGDKITIHTVSTKTPDLHASQGDGS